MLYNAKVGDRIMFPYYGGTAYGSNRRVKVTKVTPTSVEGIDESNNRYKKYERAKMGSVRFIEIAVPKSMKEELADLNVLFRSQPQYVSKILPEFNNRWSVRYSWNASLRKLVMAPIVGSYTVDVDGCVVLTHPVTQRICKVDTYKLVWSEREKVRKFLESGV